MRRNSMPYWIKKIINRANRFYIERFIVPQFDSCGTSPEVAHPRHLVIFGRDIHIGKFAQIICSPENAVRLTSWPGKNSQGKIMIGDYCLIAPGVKISSGASIRIGDNCMLAANVSITDSDWHGVYNRIRPFRCTKPVDIGNNVWIGESAMILKGVQIGENSIIGAGSVVTKSIPANVIAAGNPARVVKSINPNKRMLKRDVLFRDPDHYFYNQDQLERYVLGNNNLFGWLATQWRPSRED